MHFDRKSIRNLFIGASGCIIVYWILHETERFQAFWGTLTGMLSPFVVGAALAFILNVPMRAIERWLKFIPKPGPRRAAAILLTFVAVILVIVGVGVLLIPQITETVLLLIPKLQAFFLKAEKFVKEIVTENPRLLEWIGGMENFNLASLLEKAMNVISSSVSVIANGAFSAVGTVFGGVMDAVIGLVFSLYCLARKEVLARQGRRILYSLIPEKITDEIIRIFRLTNATFSNFISGQCLEALILGCMFAIAMAILKMPYIPLVSVLIAVTALIPIVGAFVGCGLGAFFILVNNPIQAVWFVVMFLVLQQIEGNMIYPRVVGTSVGLPGMWVLVAVTVGGDLMGVGGMLAMIPLASVLYTLVGEYTSKRLAALGISQEKLVDHPPELKSKFKEKREKRREQRLLKQMKELAEHTLHHKNPGEKQAPEE